MDLIDYQSKDVDEWFSVSKLLSNKNLIMKKEVPAKPTREVFFYVYSGALNRKYWFSKIFKEGPAKLSQHRKC